ncbi:unnamed protein product [Cyclocybe aegerita]|uniref:F-box domain-containing protein n=1 Tax=Cyclocybe aegerita TaxID=1973307 RepID=A0A8S0WHT7_CYCAE|nr:unnamed protein product [Cyclocybe aegerita]
MATCDDASPSSQHDTTRPRPGRITSYFTPSAPLTRHDTEEFSDGTTLAASSSQSSAPGTACFSPSPTPTSDDVPPQKKFKITASNGWQVKLKDVSRKRMKREPTLESDDFASGNETDSRFYALGSLKRQGSRAKLAMLPSLPLDILFEIFGCLRPLDLLHLARTTKSIRALLLHRSATSVWKRAFSGDSSLPPCPDDVSLPSWASLAFDKFCQNCLAPQIRNVDFILRVRYCSRCAKTKLFSSQLLKKDKKLHVIILQAVPFSYWSGRNYKSCTVDDKESFVELLDSHQGDRSAFVEERKAWVKKRTEHGKLWKKWLEDILEDREAEIDELRNGRNQKIRQLVRELGFSEELTFLDRLGCDSCAIQPFPTLVAFNDHTDVKAPKALTDKMWSNMKDDMIDYMEMARRLRLQEARVLLERRRRLAIYTAYVVYRRQPETMLKYPSSTFLPGPVDFIEWYRCQRLIKRTNDNPLSEEDLDDIFKGFDGFVSSWRKDKIHELWYTTLDLDASLPLRSPLRWSPTTNPTPPPSSGPSTSQLSYFGAPRQCTGGTMTGGRSTRASSPRARLTLMHRRCASPSCGSTSSRTIPVHHTLKAHFGDSRVTWERVSPSDAAKARELEAVEATKRGYLTPDKRKLWKCIRCRDTTHDRGRMTWEELKTHFTHNPKHGNPDEMEGKDEVTYYSALDYSERERPPVKMVPAKVES